MKISNAKISFNPQGTPVSAAFDDVYFSNESGIKETQYVFIDSNTLHERWQNSQKTIFSIGETGFGTGLNFLVAVQQFLLFKKNNPKSPLQTLYFYSTEKFPLTKADLSSALALWPELTQMSQPLIENYPLALPGLHRIHLFNNQVVLDLWLGDATEGFEAAYSHNSGRIDAWFLDGFAPSKNDSMWTESLFQQINRLSSKSATFATFTAAGIVKRGLKEAGFIVSKQKGFGKKREMLVGFLAVESEWSQKTRQTPIYCRHSPQNNAEHIAIVGGGIAAAICAVKFIKAGKKVSLYCADDTLAQGASGNEQGGFYPQLNAEASIASQIHAHSFLYARRFYDDLLSEGHEFKHQWCGVLQLSFSNNVTKRYENMIHNQTWPASLVNWLDPDQASKLANVDIPCASLSIPLGGWLSPPDLVKACIASAQEGKFALFMNHRLLDIQSDCSGNKATLNFAINKNSEADTANVSVDAVVLACGSESPLLKDLDLPFRLTRGQVERIPSNTALTPLNSVLCHKGYMTPSAEGYHAMGSTYIKDDTQTDYRAQEAQTNLQMHQKALAAASWVNQIKLNQGEEPGRAAIRCSLPDHLPAVGAVPLIESQKQELSELYKAKADDYYPIPSVKPNVFVLTGLGSRGLTTAPLMAEILLSQICDRPLPLESKLLNALNPNRFLIRDLIRRR